MKRLSDLRYNVDPKTGAWIEVEPGREIAPYVTMDSRPVAPGETYTRCRPNGNPTSEQIEFPKEQTTKIIATLHFPDGSGVEFPHRDGDGKPLERIHGVEL